MNRSHSLTSASKPPKLCLINCLSNRDKLKLNWSCARLSKCSASDTIAAPHQGSGPSDVLKANNSQGELLGGWRLIECLDEAMWTGQKLRKFLSLFHLGFFQMCFFATQHSAAPPSGTSRTAATILPPWQDLRHIMDTDTADTMPPRICPGRSTDCSRMVIPSHNLKGIPSVNATCEIALNYITV